MTLESQDIEARLRQVQFEQLESSSEQLQQNLAIARGNLESLLVRAPRAGKLTALNAEIGESKSRGQRMGQIDDVDRFKAVGRVNEFYLNRVLLGQRAGFKLSNIDYEVQITKIYPEVSNGQFEVDLAFAQDQQPSALRRGQTLQLRLELGDQTRALLLDNGAFFQDTGGAWVFALTENGDSAYRARVELGRRNPKQIEVISGLSAGDQVIVSQYTGFMQVDRVIINQ